MKIVHFVEASATGTLSMLALQANSQAEAGHNVHVCYSRRPETPQDLSSHFCAEVTLKEIPLRGAASVLTGIWRIRKYLVSTRSDIFIMHSSYAGFLGRLAAVSVKNGPRCFYIPHCISFMRRDVGTFKLILFACLELVASLKKCVYVACSESERRVIRKFLPLVDVEVVENAVPMSELGFEPSIQKCQVITVGMIRNQKGPDDFVAIANKVRASAPETSFVWVGDGDDRETKQVLASAGVEVTGWLSKSEVFKKLRESSVYLSTARWEGMPVSLIEAFYSGVPVVASRVAGNLDVVEHSLTGFLYDSNPEGAEFVVQLLNDNKKRKLVSDTAKIKARTRFSAERYSEDLGNLILPADIE